MSGRRRDQLSSLQAGLLWTLLGYLCQEKDVANYLLYKQACYGHCCCIFSVSWLCFQLSNTAHINFNTLQRQNGALGKSSEDFCRLFLSLSLSPSLSLSLYLHLLHYFQSLQCTVNPFSFLPPCRCFYLLISLPAVARDVILMGADPHNSSHLSVIAAGEAVYALLGPSISNG